MHEKYAELLLHTHMRTDGTAFSIQKMKNKFHSLYFPLPLAAVIIGGKMPRKAEGKYFCGISSHANEQ